VDFGYAGLLRDPATGQLRRAWAFVMVLAWSRHQYVEFVFDQKIATWLLCHRHALEFFGGAPERIVPDNLKAAVVRACFDDPLLQQTYRECAEHYGFLIAPCRGATPQHKGKVERAIQYIKASFLEGRSFTDLDDLNAQLRCWLAEVANVRIHATTKERPVDRLAADLAAMLPIGETTPFPAVTIAERHADHDARISYLGVRYSVDPEVLTGRRRGNKVEVHHGTDERIRIFSHGLLVGEHKVLPSGSPPQDAPLHAAKRRTLRQLPTWRRDRGPAPRFDQKSPDCDDLAVMAPQVAERPLSAYEAA